MKIGSRRGRASSGRMPAAYIAIIAAVGLTAAVSFGSMLYLIVASYVGFGSDTATVYASQIRKDCRPLVPLVEALERQGPLDGSDYEAMRSQAESLRRLPGGAERCNVSTRPLDDGTGTFVM